MQIRAFSFAVFTLLITLDSFGLDLTKVNFNYQYNQSTRVEIAHRVIEDNGRLSVLFHIKGDSLNSWNANFLIQEKYISAQHDTLSNFRLDTLVMTRKQGYFRLTFDPGEKGVLILSVYVSGENLYYLEDIQVKSPLGFTSNYLVDDRGLPVFRSYVNSSDFTVKGSDSLHAYAYLDNFKSADPPMGAMKTIAPSIDIDSSFYFDGSTDALEKYKFYLVQEDTLSQNALTLLKCPPYYPNYKTIEELVDPLTYITTSSEIRSITNSYSKKAFELFWINTYGTKFRAKNAIKLFYDKVEEANRLFTDYKQGWKTDRGMIYIIFGLPDKVERDERIEIWTYYGKAEFEFLRISTLFTPIMYSLRRDRKYENLWYEEVGKIRKGL